MGFRRAPAAAGLLRFRRPEGRLGNAVRHARRLRRPFAAARGLLSPFGLRQHHPQRERTRGQRLAPRERHRLPRVALHGRPRFGARRARADAGPSCRGARIRRAGRAALRSGDQRAPGQPAAQPHRTHAGASGRYAGARAARLRACGVQQRSGACGRRTASGRGLRRGPRPLGGRRTLPGAQVRSGILPQRGREARTLRRRPPDGRLCRCRPGALRPLLRPRGAVSFSF